MPESGAVRNSCRSILAKRLVDGLLPARCLWCAGPANAGGLCAPCRAALPYVADACPRCALPGPFGGRLCGACIREPPHFERAMAALLYAYPVDRLVQLFKFRRHLAAGAILAFEMTCAAGRLERPRPDVLLPVPLHFWRRARRGFNQSELLARRVGKALRLPVAAGLLWRSRHTAAQSGLDLSGRRRNLRGAFACRGVGGLNVVLIDDVLTTGTTLDECARTLLSGGASGVSVWVAARVPAPRAVRPSSELPTGSVPAARQTG